MRIRQLNDDCLVIPGSVNTGVLRAGDRALLFDCAAEVTAAVVAELGIARVERICCTQHRLPNVGGAYAFVATGAELIVPRAERHLFDAVEAYWANPQNRFHNYHAQPGPQVLPRSLAVARDVAEPDVIEWGGFTIRVLDTPGATDGSISYLVETGGVLVAFVGDALYGPGRVWDFHSLQKGHGLVGDYHGFIGNRFKLVPSLDKLVATGTRVWVPAHGKPFRRPQVAVALFKQRLDALWRNYTAISCLNHYFPGVFDDTKDDPLRLKPVATREPPSWVRRVPGPAFAVVSDTGAALAIDCGTPAAVTTYREWLAAGRIKSVDACWLTHYHDDHTTALPELRRAFNCPVWTDRHMAEVVAYPLRYFLPCLASVAVPVAKATTDAETWRWQEFTLTAFHFPGQTLYHSGLLVEGHGSKVFFAGDSGSPTGIDDHTTGNRNFLGAGRGFRRCFEIWRQCRPDYILNQHQDRAFVFSDAELDYLDRLLAEREGLVAALLPWPHHDLGTDQWWCRTYPYEQVTTPGAAVEVAVQFTNHAATPLRVAVAPVLPPGWPAVRRTAKAVVPPGTSGTTADHEANPDGAVTLRLKVPADATPGRYVVPFSVTVAWGMDRRLLGPYRHAIVEVTV